MKRKKKTSRRKLNERNKLFLVQQLACFASPTEAAEALKEERRVIITPQACEHYDPSKRAGASLARHLRAVFEETRKAFLKHIEKNVPEANKAVRVRHLAVASRRLREARDWDGMADMFEHIAKELGNVHSNRRELTGKAGGAIKIQEIDMMTEDAVDEELRKYGIDPDQHPAPAKTH